MYIAQISDVQLVRPNDIECVLYILCSDTMFSRAQARLFSIHIRYILCWFSFSLSCRAMTQQGYLATVSMKVVMGSHRNGRGSTVFHHKHGNS
ncbi:hypothetical protein GDO81_004595 [Engystomops pustulosus]|uniref:Uncharacterized protein n=1 Tax=Engystomops pustulosus TaxID=76066 RepID=A0AAV6ZTD1_ENGPU|nr:hypothetical protein GDO81_004595 [Engystomops pustulosus]